RRPDRRGGPQGQRRGRGGGVGEARGLRGQPGRRDRGRRAGHHGAGAADRAGAERRDAGAGGPALGDGNGGTIMQFVIVSGLSGAGKSTTASFLEDLGFYVVDNMPADLIPQFAQLCLATKGRYERVALVTDVRGSLTFEGLFKA